MLPPLMFSLLLSSFAHASDLNLKPFGWKTMLVSTPGQLTSLVEHVGSLQEARDLRQAAAARGNTPAVFAKLVENIAPMHRTRFAEVFGFEMGATTCGDALAGETVEPWRSARESERQTRLIQFIAQIDGIDQELQSGQPEARRLTIDKAFLHHIGEVLSRAFPRLDYRAFGQLPPEHYRRSLDLAREAIEQDLRLREACMKTLESAGLPILQRTEFYFRGLTVQKAYFEHLLQMMDQQVDLGLEHFETLRRSHSARVHLDVAAFRGTEWERYVRAKLASLNAALTNPEHPEAGPRTLQTGSLSRNLPILPEILRR